jgi:hypothetical protein
MNPFRLLTAELERLRIPYLLGGSHASSLHGESRATMDVDLVAAVDVSHVEPLVAALGPRWYAEPAQMREAIRHGQSFNLIFVPTVEKFDIFPATAEFHFQQLERATREAVAFSGDTIECPVATAEDILLAKLQWYRIGGETSERQWNDIVGIVGLNPNLDRTYLETWGARLQVIDLLDRALRRQPRGAQQH